ncbi:MAG: hypothetical protein WKF97_25220 [Chitinophagaceae bacterium]
MNPWVTNNQLTSEYDGAVVPYGVTALFAFNSFTSGVAIGIDHLLDRNRKFWIYRGRPWVGVTLGLNLN